MTSEFQTVQLEEVAELKGGYAFKSQDYTESGRFVLRTLNIDESGRITRDSAAYISEEKAKEYERFELEPWDTLFVMVGATLGKVGLVKESDLPALLNQNMWVVRANKERVNPRCLHYAFGLTSKSLLGWASGAARDFVRRDDFRKMHLNLPARSQQDQIAHILGTLDDKIELNRRMNETLEAIARALFKSWFVDFDPVRAKMSGEPPESICQRLGLTPDLLALFPERLVDSELGEIPDGWAVKPLPAVIEVNPARALKKGVVAPYLDMANMPTTSARALTVVEREFGSGMKFKNGDTLVARITPCLENGKTCFVDFLSDGQVGWGSTEYIVLRPKHPLPNEYAYFLARTDIFRNHAIANMTGTSGRQRVPATAFDGFQLAVPNIELAKKFGRFARSVITEMRAHDEESFSLSTMRDALLPKLLSGELRVPAAEKTVELMA